MRVEIPTWEALTQPGRFSLNQEKWEEQQNAPAVRTSLGII